MELRALYQIQLQVNILEQSIKRLSELGGEVPATMIHDLQVLKLSIEGAINE